MEYHCVYVCAVAAAHPSYPLRGTHAGKAYGNRILPTAYPFIAQPKKRNEKHNPPQVFLLCRHHVVYDVDRLIFGFHDNAGTAGFSEGRHGADVKGEFRFSRCLAFGRETGTP
jgi:hypothetical protein